MRNLSFAMMGLLAVLLTTAVNAQQKEATKEPAAAASGQVTAVQARQEDEKAIRLAAQAVVQAYNAGDAKSLAALFAPDAEIVNEQGQATQGQEAIQQAFAAVFAAHPKTQMEISIQSIRFVGPTVAIEDGTTTVTHEVGETPEHNRYTVVHVQKGDKWQMVSARDLPDEPGSAEEELKQLDWLVGDWVDESPDALIITSYRWSDNKCYIVGEFKVQIGGRPAMTGSQRIGWDPLAKQLRSWMFDSEGGFAEGLWTRQGNQWIAKMTGVTRDGKAASSTNTTTRVTKDRMTWQSRDRLVGGEAKPNIEEIPIVRKPPQTHVTNNRRRPIFDRRILNENKHENDFVCGRVGSVLFLRRNGRPRWRWRWRSWRRRRWLSRRWWRWRLSRRRWWWRLSRRRWWRLWRWWRLSRRRRWLWWRRLPR